MRKKKKKESRVKTNTPESAKEEKLSVTDSVAERFVRFVKTTKGKVVVGVVSVSVITGGVLFYNHYEKTKPVGIEDKVQLSEKSTKTGVDYRAKNVLAKQADGGKSQDRGYSYLFETRIEAGNDAFFGKNDGIKLKQGDPNKEEFNGATKLINNSITLLSTKDPADVSAAAALYSRNSKNYRFTKDENLIALGIGRDALIFHEYLDSLDGVSQSGLAALEADFGQSFRGKMATPYSAATIATQLGQAGLDKLVDDDVSTPIKGAVRYTGATQFKDYQDIIQKTTRIDIHTTYQNKALEAWNTYQTLNSVYEVHFEEISTKRTVTVIVLEDQKGQLRIYGVYYDKIYNEDHWIRDFRKVGGTTQSVSEKDITWKVFQEKTR